MPIRILHIISSVNPKDGGPVESVKQLAAAHHRLGHSVEVACVDRPDDEWVKNFPLRCHAVGQAKLGTYGYSPALVPWLKANRHRYDVAVVNGIWQYHTFAAWRALAGTGLPYFVFTHGMLDPWFKRTYPLKHLKKWLFWPWSVYRTLRDASAVLFTCEEERRLARESFWLYQCKEFVVSYGTSAPPDLAAQQRQAFDARFPDLVTKRKLLFLGRVHPKKGADLLFKALAAIKARDPRRLDNVQVVMAGPADHAYGLEMQQLVQTLGLSEHVTWTGMLTGDAKWGAFRAADAFILPSHQENFGIAVAEALACGLPVLISNQVNIWREILEDEAAYVEPDDQPGTERLITRWLETPPSQWAQMKANAVDCFNRRFLVDRTAESFAAAVEQFTPVRLNELLQA